MSIKTIISFIKKLLATIMAVLTGLVFSAIPAAVWVMAKNNPITGVIGVICAVASYFVFPHFRIGLIKTANEYSMLQYNFLRSSFLGRFI